MRHPDTALFSGGVLVANSPGELPLPGMSLRHKASKRIFDVLDTRTSTDGSVGVMVRYDDGGSSWTWAVDAETWWEEWQDATPRQTTPGDEPVPATEPNALAHVIEDGQVWQSKTDPVARRVVKVGDSFAFFLTHYEPAFTVGSRWSNCRGTTYKCVSERPDDVTFVREDKYGTTFNNSKAGARNWARRISDNEKSAGTYSTAPVAVTPITLDSVKATIDELSKANDTWRESDDELRARIAHKFGTKYSMGSVCACSGKRLDLIAEQFGIKRLADDRPIDGGTWVPEPSFMAPRWRYREAFGKTPPVATSTALPTQYRRAPNGRGYRVLDVDSERALMRQDDGLRVTAPLATVAAWKLEGGPETMTAAEQHEARGRLALEWPRPGETMAETLRRVTGSVELPPEWMWARGQPSPWEGAVMWEAIK